MSPQHTPPDRPYGFRASEELRHPSVGLAVGSVVLFVLSLWGYATLMVAVRSDSVVFDEVIAMLLLLMGSLAPLLAFAVATVIVHELVHGLAFSAFGYRVSYGIAPDRGTFYTAAFQQFVMRDHLFAVALAPVTFITALLLPLLVFAPLPLAAVALFLVSVNTAGSVGDFYTAVRVLRTPSGAVFYDDTASRSYVYEPIDSTCAAD
ncbi:MAG: DUF3267 domain-containing protein [Halalkalicoccus sp.]|nr:DUF3267 domain-containing protein [Halalkalicoccus sp.]